MDAYFNGSPQVSFCLDATPNAKLPCSAPIPPLWPGSSPSLSSHAYHSQAPQALQPWQNQLAPGPVSSGDVLQTTTGNLRGGDELNKHDRTLSSISSPSSVAGHVWSLSQDAMGCREVQAAFDMAGSDQARVRLAMELFGHVREASQCPHANHVLRKCINTMHPSSLKFMIDELAKEGAEGVGELVRHRYGCRILEALLRNCSADQLQPLVRHLLVDAVALCLHMYGNFVIQRLLEYGTDDQRHYISSILRANMIAMGSNFYGSVVIGTALKHSLREDQLLLARSVLSVNGLLAAILHFRHGKLVKDQLFAVLEPCDQEFALVQLKATPMKTPRSHRAGKKVVMA